MSEDYASIEVNNVVIHSPGPFDSNQAVPKSYVDNIRDTIMGEDVSEALDTLKELGNYLQDSEVAGGIVAQLNAVKDSVTLEVQRATTAEATLIYENSARVANVLEIKDSLTYLENRANNETASRQAVDQEHKGRMDYLEDRANILSGQHGEQEGRITVEVARATTAEGNIMSWANNINDNLTVEINRATVREEQLQTYANNINDNVNAEISRALVVDQDLLSRTDTLTLGLQTEIIDRGASVLGLESRVNDSLSLKADLIGSSFSGPVSFATNVSLGEYSYLMFGPRWRVKASNDGTKIVFEHLKNDDVWRVALPFICSN
jgi:hypothetical protein